MRIVEKQQNNSKYNNIHPKTEEVYIKNLRNMNGEKRLKIAFQLSELAISLCKANILENNPDISEQDLKRKLFERLGHDIATIDKLLKK